MPYRTSLPIGGCLLLALVATPAATPCVGLSDTRQAPERDRPLPPAEGTGVVRGRVVDGATGRPVGRARIVLSHTESSASVLASADGTFAFRDVVGGSIVLRAEKSGYVAAHYPERSRDTVRMRQFQLAPGQKVDDVVIRLFRMMAITGRVVDEFGDPLENVRIQAWRVSSFGGRVIVRASAGTNDNGEFRLNRLEPGRYLVAAMPMPGWSRGDADRDVPSLGMTFYPGVANLNEAQPVEVKLGATVSDLNFTLLELPRTSVAGLVTDLDGLPVGAGGVTAFAVIPHADIGRRWVVGAANVRPDGTFLLRVPSGEYDLESYVGPTTAAPGYQYRASARVTVGAEPVTNVRLTASPHATLSGRVVFDAARKAPADSRQIRLTLTSARDWEDQCRAATVVEIRPDWTFSHADVSGRCVLRSGESEWTLKSVRQGQTDLTDREIEFRPGTDLHDLQVMLTDRVTELVPEVTDEKGIATAEYVLLAFSDDPERWGEHSRYVRAHTPSLFSNTPAGRDLARSLRALPPGSYYVVALEDLAYEDLRDGTFLEALIRHATRLSLTEGERRTIALRRVRFPPP